MNQQYAERRKSGEEIINFSRFGREHLAIWHYVSITLDTHAHLILIDG
jgi:hypothetical protein